MAFQGSVEVKKGIHLPSCIGKILEFCVLIRNKEIQFALSCPVNED